MAMLGQYRLGMELHAFHWMFPVAHPHDFPVLGLRCDLQALRNAFALDHQRVVAGGGKTSQIEHSGHGVFRNLPSGFAATRYHSLVIERESIPQCLEVTAQSEDGEIMGVRHREHPVEGVQFHPEAILTEHGHQLLKNFLQGRGE